MDKGQTSLFTFIQHLDYLLVKGSKPNKFTEVGRIIFGLPPIKPDSSKYMSRCVLQQLIKIWHGHSYLITAHRGKHQNMLALLAVL